MSLPVVKDLTLDDRVYKRGLGCVHCGLCLPACPTYMETFNEADSPRGRISLMLALAEGRTSLTPESKQHLDLCLDCRACETACPSGVVYHELIEETRHQFAITGKDNPTLGDRILRLFFFHITTKPSRLRFSLLPVRLMQKTGVWNLVRKSGVLNLMPAKLEKMTRLLGESGPLWAARLPEHTKGIGVADHAILQAAGKAKPRKSVGLLAGCVGSVLYERVNRMAVELVAACGADVIVPGAQVCCGAIHHHNAADDDARKLARANIDAFLPVGHHGVDYIITTIAGCGAMLKEYDFLLRDDPLYSPRAKIFANRVRDVTEVLELLGLPPAKFSVNETITYHDACHLAHAQRVTAAPRALLSKVPGLTLVPLPESEICCGAAGTYNLQQPEMATRLADRKLANIASTGATKCISGNIGCTMHLAAEAKAKGQDLKLLHPVEILHAATFGVR